ncbi:MAG: glycoside hydrolase family 20 zincin-like fold domain-containing protein [Candidatus Hodarchaeota archaeon]
MKYLIIGNLGESKDSKNMLEHLDVCPIPREMEFLDGFLSIKEGSTCYLSDASDKYMIDQLNDELLFYKASKVKIIDDAPDVDVKSLLDSYSIDDKEGYQVETKGDSIVIIAKKSAGLFYGIQLLYQLFIEDCHTIAIPKVKVRDWPKMAIRGISQDISRGQSPKVDAVKRHIKLMSRFRLNLYQFMIEDMFEFKKYPQIGKDRGPLTPEMVKEIEEFAKDYHVEVMPIFQNLSHMENMLLDPELKEYGDYPGSGSLNMAHPKLYDFLSDLLSEIAPAFKSTKFHIGCDESWDVGVYGAKEFIKEKGMDKALLDHYLWIIDELKKHGKDTFFLYHDISFKYDHVLQGLPKDGSAILVYWRYEIKEDWPEIDRIVSFGVPFVVSSSAESWTKPFPDLPKAFKSNQKLIANGMKKGAIGQINSAWGDNGQENFHENNLMQFCYSSAYSWNDDGFENDDAFLKAYSRALFGVVDGKLDKLFELVSRIFEVFPWKYISKWLGFLWRHPYHSKTLDNSHYDEEERMDINANLVFHEGDMEDQREFCREIVELSKKLKYIVRRNITNIEYYEYAGLLLEYFIDKIQTTARVTNLCASGLDEGKIEEIMKRITDVIDQIDNLRARFEKIWLYNASRPTLDRILQFWDWQKVWQQEKIDQVGKMIPWMEPYIESEWICLDEPERTQEPRFFRKAFNVDVSKLESAYIQLAPGNYATLWINGKKVGYAQCSYQSAQPVMDHNIEFWNVKDFLVDGENLIAIEGVCYMNGNPIINVYMEMKQKDGSMEKVLSNASWKASSSAGSNWQEISHDDSKWINATSKGKPPKQMGEICLPRFEKGLKSKTTHHGFCRILRSKASQDGPVTEFFDDFFFYEGNII